MFRYEYKFRKIEHSTTTPYQLKSVNIVKILGASKMVNGIQYFLKLYTDIICGLKILKILLRYEYYE